VTAIGVITRTKNHPLLLSRALDSVLEQTLPDWKLVVVNDGGEPDPVDALVKEREKAFAGRVQVIHHPKSHGMEAASNAGLNALNREWFFTLTEARVVIEDWRWKYNNLRPHRSLGYLTPLKFALKAPPLPSLNPRPGLRSGLTQFSLQVQIECHHCKIYL
jgi:glycosyltransferase involved in cell wall biosynthesis